MNIKRKSRNPRAAQLLLNFLHVAACLIIIIGSALAIWDTKAYGYLFPIVFLAASLLNLGNGLLRLRDGGERRRQRTQATVQLLAAAALLLVAIVSAMTVRGM